MSGPRHNQYIRGVSVTGRSAASAPFELIALVASLGGRADVSRVLATLPAGFPAHLLVVLHGRRDPHRDVLPRLFQRSAPLPTRAAPDGTVVGGPGVTVIPTGHLAEIDRTRRITLTPAESPDDLRGRAVGALPMRPADARPPGGGDMTSVAK